MKEMWRPIKGYEGKYEISSLGRVRSITGWKYVGNDIYQPEGIMMKQGVNRGYYKVDLCKHGKHYTYKVHRLVAEAFIPNPHHHKQVNHKDENRLNNHVTNLEWCTQEYNLEYGTRVERTAKKLSRRVGQYTLDGKLVKVWQSTHDAGRHGYHQGHVWACCRGKAKTHAGYRWRFIK